MTTLDAARAFLGSGFMPLPIPPRSKNPGFNGWQRFTVTKKDLPQHFSGELNIGLLLGEPSRGLVDVDLDWPEAVRLAPRFLPATKMIGGRSGAPRSHYWYLAPGAKTVKLQDPDLLADKSKSGRAMIVELRSTGGQTVVAPSIHPSGEAYEWYGPLEPTVINPGDLRAAVMELAAAALLARRWPNLPRHDFALPFAGMLWYAGWSLDRALHFVEAIASAAGDAETPDRLRAVRDTYAKLEKGEKATAEPTLKRYLGAAACERLQAWLELIKRSSPDDAKQSKASAAPGVRTSAPQLQSAAAAGEEEELWEIPVPFHHHDLPSFPADVLPPWVRAFVEGLSVALQTPVDLSAMMALTACSAALAGKVRIQARRGWVEPLNLFVAAALSPANRKTATLEAIKRPLLAYEEQLVEDSRLAIAEERNERRTAERRLEHLQKKCAGLSGPDLADAKQEAKDLARQLAEWPEPKEPQLLADNTTPESLTSLLAEQGGRIAIFSAEGELFEAIAGRYSNGIPNFDVFLKGHSGEDMRVNRRNRVEIIKAPALVIGLAIQPDVIRGLAEKPGFRGRGLLGRFLYALPPSNLGKRLVRASPLEDAAREEYSLSVAALLRGPHMNLIRLSDQADDLLASFERWIEPQLAEGEALSPITDWAGKLAGAVVRLSGILHLAENVNRMSPWPELVLAPSVERAIEIGRYLIPHAKAAYGEMGADLKIDAARRVLRWIEERLRGEKKAIFTKREALRGCRSFRTADEIEPPLRLLEKHGYIRNLGDIRKTSIRPSEVYQINPLLAGGSQHVVDDLGRESLPESNWEDAA